MCCGGCRRPASVDGLALLIDRHILVVPHPHLGHIVPNVPQGVQRSAWVIVQEPPDERGFASPPLVRPDRGLHALQEVGVEGEGRHVDGTEPPHACLLNITQGRSLVGSELQVLATTHPRPVIARLVPNVADGHDPDAVDGTPPDEVEDRGVVYVVVVGVVDHPLPTLAAYVLQCKVALDISFVVRGPDVEVCVVKRGGTQQVGHICVCLVAVLHQYQLQVSARLQEPKG
mmetsp:Transcript_139098/g.432775  ORF Transcript_139098/g.432775 Transcript_139098/m.432775 type:complete len:230 (-) Transcript_139098:1662-2351(-)